MKRKFQATLMWLVLFLIAALVIYAAMQKPHVEADPDWRNAGYVTCVSNRWAQAEANNPAYAGNSYNFIEEQCRLIWYNGK